MKNAEKIAFRIVLVLLLAGATYLACAGVGPVEPIEPKDPNKVILSDDKYAEKIDVNSVRITETGQTMKFREQLLAEKDMTEKMIAGLQKELVEINIMLGMIDGE